MIIQWPKSLNNITHNMNSTELWMLVEAFNAGNCKVTFRRNHIAYSEYWIDYLDDRFLVKASARAEPDWQTSPEPYIYFVKKYHDMPLQVIKRCRSEDKYKSHRSDE